MGGEKKKKGVLESVREEKKGLRCVSAAALLPRLPLGSLKTATGSV